MSVIPDSHTLPNDMHRYRIVMRHKMVDKEFVTDRFSGITMSVVKKESIPYYIIQYKTGWWIFGKWIDSNEFKTESQAVSWICNHCTHKHTPTHAEDIVIWTGE